MLDINSNQEINANENHNGIPATTNTPDRLKLKRLIKPSFGKNMEQMEFLYMPMSVRWCNNFVKVFINLFEN